MIAGGARKPATPSSALDELAYSKLVHSTGNNGEQAGPEELLPVAGYEEPLQSSSGSTNPCTTPSAMPYAYTTLPKVHPESAAVPVPKPREQRSFSTGKQQMEVPEITISLQEQHTYTTVNKKKSSQKRPNSLGKTNDLPPSPMAKPTQLLHPQKNTEKKGKFSRRKSSPAPVNKQTTVFATYSIAQDPDEEAPRRALSGGKPPVRPKPKGCIISSYSLAVPAPTGNDTTGGECEYDVAISSVVLPKNERTEEYDFPLPHAT